MPERRKTLQVVNEHEVLEGEIIDVPVKKENSLEERQLERKHELSMKVVESLPDVISIVKDIVAIQKIKANSQAELSKMDKEIETIKVNTEDFVRREFERRQMVQSKSIAAQSLLRDLYDTLSKLDASDAVKEKVVDAFNTTIHSVLQDK